TFTVTTRSVGATATAYLTASLNDATTTIPLTLRKAGENPRVPQGDSASFRHTGAEAPAVGLPWDILRAGQTVASSSQPKALVSAKEQ
ncbi:MAG TPA: hypothetical protein VL359_06060, partial [bacterium]|nr:hypothetical protein [bacterium]